MYKIIKKEQLSSVVWLMEVEAPLVARHCEPGQFIIVKHSDEGERIPLTMRELSPEEQEDVNGLIERLENDDDVVNVFHNMA